MPQGWAVVPESKAAPAWTVVDERANGASPPDEPYLSAVAHHLKASVSQIATNPTTYAVLAGMGAAPFTAGASIPAAMGIEGVAAAAGTLAGHGVKAATGRPSGAADIASDTATNAALASLGPAVGPALRLARNAPTSMLDMAGHLPVVGGPARILSGALKIAGRMAPQAAEESAPSAPSWLDRPVGPEGADTPAWQFKDGTTPQPPRPPVMRIVRPSAPAPAAEPAAPVTKWTPDPANVAAERSFMDDLIAKRTAAKAPAPAPPPPTLAPRGGLAGGLSPSEQQALDAEISARGGIPKIDAATASRYLQEHGQMLPPGTRATRQAGHLESARNDARYKFLIDNPLASAVLPTALGALLQLQGDAR